MAYEDVIGPPCRIYPAESGRAVGPGGVPDNEGGASVIISIIEGSGSVGSYQPQEADSMSGPWFNVGSALSSPGVYNVSVRGSYMRVLPLSQPDSGVRVRVCFRVDIE